MYWKNAGQRVIHEPNTWYTWFLEHRFGWGIVARMSNGYDISNISICIYRFTLNLLLNDEELYEFDALICTRVD